MNEPQTRPAAPIVRNAVPGFAAVVAVLVLAEIVSAFELSMMYVTLPTLMADFQKDASTVAWVVTIYLLVSASAALLGGRLGDMYGRRKVMLVVLILAGIGSFISLIGGSLEMIIIGRGIQGTAGAVMGLAFGLAREHLQEKKLPVGVSMIGASALIAGAGGALIAGLMIDVYSWHGIFLFAGVLAAIAAIAVLLVIPKDQPRPNIRNRQDLFGALLLPIGASGLLLGLSNSSKTGFFTVQAGGIILAGAIAVAVWIWWELHTPSPIVNLRMFKNKQIALVMTATFLAAVGPIGGLAVPSQMVLQYPPELGFGLGFTATAAGTFSCVTALVGYFFSPLGGRLAQMFGARIVFITGLLLMTCAVIPIVLLLGNLPVFLVAMTVNAVGVSLTFGALPNVLIEAVPASHTSESTGTNTMVRNIGQSVATAIGAFLLARRQDPATSLVAEQGVGDAFIFVAVFGALSLIVACFLNRRPVVWNPENTGSVANAPKLVQGRS
ncbi:MFS transporter [Arthrobacter sp. MYb213]|uniref:MFS transporter n=1 Tax=Arthrobacter sp. MYb213 TaxID=1848595 RepID=UPI000CFC0367|nr:MFS transporter [Arthrobacter sp. MYb213]PRB70410.1 MFS transporter [Arthrobacter sp. MYb213]